MGNKKYSLIKGTNVEIDSSNITGKLIKINGKLTQENEPTPDIPSEIEVVGNNVNFFDKNGEKTNIYIGDDGSEIVSIENNFIKQELIPSSKKYVMSYLENIGDAYIRLSYYNENTFISREISMKNKFVFTVPDGCTKIDIRVDDEEKKYFTKLKIEQGIVTTGYTSYGCGGIDYKATGKNLIGVKDSSSSTNLGITAEYDKSTGVYTLNGTSTNAGYIKLYDDFEVSTYTNLNSKNRTKMYKGDYTLSYKYISGTKTTGTANVMIRDCNDSIKLPRYEIAKFDIENQQLQFTVDENHLTQKYIWFAKDITFTNFKFSIQLEYGKTQTEHEPYKEHSIIIELPNGEFMAKIGDVEDYIDNQGILHKYIGKVVLNGSETWTKNGSSNLYYCNDNVLNNIKLQVGNTTLPYLICSHFKADTVDNVWNKQTDNTITVFTDGTVNPRICTSKFTTVDAFKTWLSEQYAAGTPVEVYYITNEPYTVDLSDEDYAKIQSVPMLIDYNNISLEPENNEFVLVYEGDEIEKSYDVTITDSGKLQPFGLTIDYNKTNLPLIAEAYEASQIITGADGDVVLNTTYGPRMFEITAVTDDFLTPEQKEAKREEIRQYLNAIKNKTAKLIIEPLNRTFEVKYSGVAEDNNLPKCVEFVIPLKSSSAYAISNETYSHTGSGDFDSETVESAGCKITITGPANVPNININGYDVIWNNVLTEGQKLIIDSKKSTVTRISSLGVKTNVMAYYSHQFPKIQKGVNFVEIISGIEDSQLKIEWNDLLL